MPQAKSSDGPNRPGSTKNDLLHPFFTGGMGRTNSSSAQAVSYRIIIPIPEKLTQTIVTGRGSLAMLAV